MKTTADAMTRAAQIAASELKSKWRDEGRKLSEFRLSDHRKAIATLLANDPIIVERATEDLRRWILAGAFGKARRAKLLSCEQTRRR
jgi:hypothetical protein